MSGEEEAGAPRVGDILFGEYAVLRELGGGGVGQVFEVTDRRSGGDLRYALKYIPAEHAPDCEELQRMYNLAAQLKHDHIVTVRRLRWERGNAYVLSDLVEGESLGEWLEYRPRVPVSIALSIAEQLARALDYSHEKDILHRDVKPANVMVQRDRACRDGAPFVVLIDLDFLLPSQASLRGQSISLKTPMLVGTMPYMAPEQWQGTLTRGVDQWALAVLIYRMVAGRLPFQGQDAGQLCAQICGATPERPEALSEQQWLALLRGMSKKRQERYDTCQELVRAIRGAMQEAGAAAGGAVSAPGPAQPAAVSSGAPARPLPASPATRIPRVVGAAVGAVAFLLLIVSADLIARKIHEDPVPRPATGTTEQAAQAPPPARPGPAQAGPPGTADPPSGAPGNSASSGSPLIGVWDLGVQTLLPQNGTITIHPDGNCTSSGFLGGPGVGRWTCSRTHPRSCKLRWNASLVDDIRISADGQSYDGRNNYGVRLHTELPEEPVFRQDCGHRTRAGLR